MVTCGLKVTLRGGLGEGRDGMDCGWEGVMEEELEWVGKSGVVSEEDMTAEKVLMGAEALRREGMPPWLKWDRRYHRPCANVRIKFPAQMLYLANSHVIGYTAVDAKKRQRASMGIHNGGDNRQTSAHCTAVMQSPGTDYQPLQYPRFIPKASAACVRHDDTPRH